MKYFLFFVLPLVGLMACGASGDGAANAQAANAGEQATPTVNRTAPVGNKPVATFDDQETSATTRLDLTLSGVPAGGKAYLIGVFAETRFRLDSADVQQGGKASFSSSTPYPHGFFFAYYPDGSSFQFLMDGDQEFSMTATKGSVVNTMQVNGSTTNEWLYESLKYQESLTPRFNEVNTAIVGVLPNDPEYAALKARQDALVAERDNYLQEMFDRDPNNLFVRFKKAGQNPKLRTELTLPDGSPDNALQVYYYRRAFWDDVNFADTVLIRTPVIANKLERYITQLTPKNPDSIISSADFLLEKAMGHPEYFKYFANWITLQFEPGETDLMDSEAVHVHMIQNYFTPELAFWSDETNIQGLQQRADQMSRSLLKQQAPDIAVPDRNGNPKQLYDETAPYVAVYMYNPTCEHCIEETPKVKALSQRRPDLKIYAVAIDTEREAWLKFVNDYGLSSWTNVFDPSNRSIYGTYYVDITPELYLLNPERKIIGKNLKASQVEEMITRDKNKG
ncbi:MAG: DUF5106 domain-containing protein [Bacteroidota bacterium]